LLVRATQGSCEIDARERSTLSERGMPSILVRCLRHRDPIRTRGTVPQ
jgi:hypothetical protein